MNAAQSRAEAACSIADGVACGRDRGGRAARERGDPLASKQALRIHGRLATPEVAAVCGLPGPRAEPSSGAWPASGACAPSATSAARPGLLGVAVR